MLSFIETIGYIAAILTTVSFVPQVILVYKTKDTASISLLMFLIFSIGTFSWGLYGILLQQLPIIMANGVTLILALYILYMKYTEKHRKGKSTSR
ncbi:MAG TPA: SemiSWEET transporter [Cytophagaceae bacterium]|jgi:MtN3 and saliva related transmembrane protein|nr:SemiSWEET transporter [Cytophagaceae bacterium]